MRILSAIFGLVIGAAFATGGVFIALETAVPTYQSWQTMQSWQSSPATLINVTGSSNDTEATYRYTVAGVDYQNDRVYVSSFKDNIGSYHQELFQHLQWLKDNYQSVTIWYNPNDPSHSVIDRDMRWGLFALMAGFCSVFILTGLAVSYSCLRSSIQKQAEQKPGNLPTTSPHPWLAKKEWKSHRIRSGAKKSMIAMWAFAIIWNAVSSPM